MGFLTGGIKMAFEHRPGQGSLFANKKKREGKKDPDLDGRIMLPDGTLHWFKAWTKQDATGQAFYSCQIGDACSIQQSAHNQAKANGYQPQNDSDIPF
jgi:hypothetical protein